MATPAMMTGRFPVSSSDSMMFSATYRQVSVSYVDISNFGATSIINLEGGIVVFYYGRRGKI